MFLSSTWTFGTNELISIISAILTFAAICVSLYLAQKSKTLKFKIIGQKISNNPFSSNQFQQVHLLNNGHIKFTCTTIGYYINKQYYFCDFIGGIKKLDVYTKDKVSEHRTKTKTTEDVLLPSYINEGDMIAIALCPFDYDFSKISKNKKVYIFTIINGKVYKKYTGKRFLEFKKISENFTEISIFNQTKEKFQARNLNEIYFR